MRQPSIVIHKGKRDEKYEFYVEDYVISFLKERKGKEEEGEILFYGRREENGRKYTIYGAGQDRHLKVFDKYELLEEVGCRLTQADPVFLLKEEDGFHEVKGYNVFYYDNAEMQDYLIHRNRDDRREYTGKEAALAGHAVLRQDKRRSAGQTAHHAVSLQLGVVFLVLVAIVINSANSYDKLEQLNQSAAEVFFVMENQEAEEPAIQEKEQAETEEGENTVQVRREEPKADVSEDALLQDSVLQENMQESAASQPQADAPDDGEEQLVQKDGSEKEEEAASQESSQETVEEEEGVEALSRNVARYYEVEKGDTLYKISQKIYGDTSHVKRICEINQITDPDNIRYGQKIILP